MLAQYCSTWLSWYENLNYDIVTNGERYVLERLRAAAPEVLFDVGANIGDWTVAASELHPSATVHAFEIVSETRAQLLERVRARRNVIVNSFGLLDTSGAVEVRAFEAQSELATVYDYPHLTNGFSVSCDVHIGDSYVRERGLKKIDLLKIDVEGAELRVLRGFEATIAAGRIDAIQFEYGLINLVAGVTLGALYEYLSARGYVVGKLYPNYVDFRPYHLKDEDFRGPNYLAVRSERTDLLQLLS